MATLSASNFFEIRLVASLKLLPPILCKQSTCKRKYLNYDLKDFYQDNNFHVTNYADTSFLVSSLDPPTLFSKIEEIMILANNWFVKNKLV